MLNPDPRTPNVGKGLSRIPEKPGTAWECRVCGYRLLDKKARFCVNCGRDFWGAPGEIPQEKPFGRGLEGARKEEG